MKIINKLIIPAAVLIIVSLMYILYFSPYKGLGSFNDYDPNSHAVKDIDVKVVHELGINTTSDGSQILFYTEDKNGTQKQIKASRDYKSVIEESDVITMTGHICTTGYEVSNIVKK